MTKEYVHTKPDIGIEKTDHIMCNAGGDILRRLVIDFFEEKLIQYQGSNVLAFTIRDGVNGRSGCYTVVPGSVVSYKSKFIGDRKDLPVSVVEPITDENKRKELSDLLVRQGFVGQIYFWP